MQHVEKSPALMAPSLIHALPKAELHVHLEGGIELETARLLAGDNKVIRKETEERFRAWQARQFRYGSLREFLEAFKRAALQLASPVDYALAANGLFIRLESQNVRYAEITLSAGVILWKKQSLPAIFEAVSQATREFATHSKLRVKWIFDAIRHFGADHAREVLGWARIFRDDGVIAFGIGGDEERGPAALFKDIYEEARGVGLHTTAHAGECGSAESVRQAVEMLGAERIGHGTAAARDPDVMRLLSERRIPVEVCLSSNAATGLIETLDAHPLRRFLDAGVEVTLNTDDPAMFGTSLENEIALATRTFALTEDEITLILKSAISNSFMSDAEKQALLSEFDCTLVRRLI